MNLYKVIFANNDIISCEVVNQKFDYNDEYYFEYKGQLIYAIFKSDSENETINKANTLIKEEIEKYKGRSGSLQAAA